MRPSKQSIYVTIITVVLAGVFFTKVKVDKVGFRESKSTLNTDNDQKIKRNLQSTHDSETTINSSLPVAIQVKSPHGNNPRVSTTSQPTSIENMTKVLFTFSRSDSLITDLTSFLSSSQQKPLVARQTNSDTGEMLIVRTNNPLPGTRYFHAQYFTDENSQTFLQHMSFEVRPGSSAMAEAIAAIHTAFPSLPNPTVKTPGFVKWSIDEKYIVWVKQLTSTDLKDNPFNAYTENDVGTVRVAIEAEIH